MPKHAAIESRETPQADEKFAALVQNADIIYFPTELPGPASRSAPATKLVDALQRSENSFALGWDLIGGEEQALLDQWAKRQLSTENLIPRLHLSGTAGERENCRALLGETKERAVRFLALRCPADLLAAARSEATLDALALLEIPRGFHPPPGDFQRFAERFLTARGMNETGLRAAYETALLAEEFAAERIVGHYREQRDEKLLIFIHRRHLGSARGVPYFVAQKIKARQLVLDSQPHRSSPSQLLALRGHCGVLWRLEIIDGSPRAGSD
ncbi:MAG TPA: ChaN family lipoprotein [Chthoniobacterales bacterium]